MPAPVPDRGQVWLADLGMVAKVRPCLVLSVPANVVDRDLVTLVPHTTSVRGTRFEVAIPNSTLKTGAFDPQGIVSVARQRLLRKLGELKPDELSRVETAVRQWLGL